VWPRVLSRVVKALFIFSVEGCSFPCHVPQRRVARSPVPRGLCAGQASASIAQRGHGGYARCQRCDGHPRVPTWRRCCPPTRGGGCGGGGGGGGGAAAQSTGVAAVGVLLPYAAMELEGGAAAAGAAPARPCRTNVVSLPAACSIILGRGTTSLGWQCGPPPARGSHGENCMLAGPIGHRRGGNNRPEHRRAAAGEVARKQG